jgi:hypothetical protein
MERIGQVAYKMDLLPTSRVHLVFQLSQHKLCASPGTQVSSTFSFIDALFQVLVWVLCWRVSHGNHTVTQGLIRWSGVPKKQATWENLDALK